MNDPVEFAPGLWRGPQPQTPEVWEKLKAAGIELVIKLNSEEEGPDDYAETTFGMKVLRLPISPLEQIVPNRFTGPTINAAVAAMEPRTYVHCFHGQDRTGLAVACWRLKQGWSKKQSEVEMLEYGFHKSLLGLWKYWKDLPDMVPGNLESGESPCLVPMTFDLRKRRKLP